MYKELDNLLSADTTVDSWYDDGCVIANEILAEFSRWKSAGGCEVKQV